MNLELVGALLTIIAIDLVLSGDNAVVIGMAARHLPDDQRKKAILWGGFGAVILRIGFTAVAALLLHVPLLQAVGAVLLIWIAVKLVRPADAAHASVREAGTLGAAIRTIILADVVMSMDNMIAVGGASHGNLWLLIFGLALSIPVLLLGSSLVSNFIIRYPWLNLVGAAILVHTAMEMFFADRLVDQRLELWWSVELIIVAAAIAAVTLYGVIAQRRQSRSSRSASIFMAHASSAQERIDG